ncbi:hypothetical protein ACFRAO_30105 [Streptomyces sp. NPDC056656]
MIAVTDGAAGLFYLTGKAALVTGGRTLDSRRSAAKEAAPRSRPS